MGESSELWPHYFLVRQKPRDTTEGRMSPDTLAEFLDSGYLVVDIDTFYKERERFFKLDQARVRKSEKQRLRRMLYGRD